MSSYEDLKELSAEAEDLINKGADYFKPEFKAWHKKCKITIARLFGDNSPELKEFCNVKYYPSVSAGYIGDNLAQRYCRDGISQALDLFGFYIKGLESYKGGIEMKDNDTVFIVHGHDGELKFKTALFLKKLGLNYIILHEEENLGNTIIEKLERCGAKAKAAVVLFTPDDFGQAKTEEERKERARQNVVFEAGYFIGLLGRNRVICVVSDKSIELPGDLNGIVYTDPHAEFDIAKELKAMGFEIDANKLL